MLIVEGAVDLVQLMTVASLYNTIGVSHLVMQVPVNKTRSSVIAEEALKVI